jgi:hypothetical protein
MEGYTYMDAKELRKLADDLMIYGTCVKIVGIRRWYNPMRWIKGKVFQKRIDPKDMYV